LTLSNLGAVSTGSYQFNVVGTSASQTVNTSLELVVSSGIPSSAVLTSPVNASTGQSTQVTFSWGAVAAATNYLIEIATDSQFNTIVDSDTVTATSYSPASPLAGATTYYWRVTAANPCGSATASSVFSFATSIEYCFATPPVAIPDNTPAGTDLDLVVTDSGLLGAMKVSVASDHTYPGDLVMTMSRGATSVVLMDQPGVPATSFGCSQDGVDVEFDDVSATPVEDVCLGTSPGVNGVLAPQEPLAAFTGLELAGTWTLKVSDNAPLDTGSISKFCLIPTVNDVDLIFPDGFE
jgi:subtilisin-like proprotein convertase family protein